MTGASSAGLSEVSADSGATGSVAVGGASSFEVQAVVIRTDRITIDLTIIGSSWLGIKLFYVGFELKSNSMIFPKITIYHNF